MFNCLIIIQNNWVYFIKLIIYAKVPPCTEYPSGPNLNLNYDFTTRFRHLEVGIKCYLFFVAFVPKYVNTKYPSKLGKTIDFFVINFYY